MTFARYLIGPRALRESRQAPAAPIRLSTAERPAGA